MSKIACIYFEGNDSKVALFEKENNIVRILKAESIDSSLAFEEKVAAIKSRASDKVKTSSGFTYAEDENAAFQRTYIQKLNDMFAGEDITKIKFIPVLAEPAVYYQKINDDKELASINVNNNGNLEATIGFVKMFDNSRLAVYPSGKSNYLESIYSLARMNNRKYLKIPAVKSAEISLLSFIAAKNELHPEEITLVVYIGKEYTRMAFLLGKEIYQLGSNLAIGKNSFNANNVIISKILLEMENSSIKKVDNIIVTGEDYSEELRSLLSQTYPLSRISFQTLVSSTVTELDNIPDVESFIVPVAVAEEYFYERSNKANGINLLPESIKEDQKVLNIQWHGYLLIALCVLSFVFFGSKINTNNTLIDQKDKQIASYQVIEARNQETIKKINSYENKINNASQTETILNRLASGRDYISSELRKLSAFADSRRVFWVSNIAINDLGKFQIEGYTLSRPAVKDFADQYQNVLLQSVVYDPLREVRTFKYKIDAGNSKEGVVNEKSK